MKLLLPALLLLINAALFAQVKGKVTDAQGNPIPYASVIVQNTYNGTSSNESGNYVLTLTQPGNYTLIFQSLGYKTRQVKANITSFPYALNVTLQDETYVLNEIAVSGSDDPADDIIRNAIKNRVANCSKVATYEADFYSRGTFKLDSVTNNVLGIKFNTLETFLDPAGTGIVYLSETVSKIKYQKPDKLYERIIASKTSGDNSGYSFNNAASADFDFYENYIEFAVNAISPISDVAFKYYDYKLDNAFYSTDNKLVNRIKVTPKNEKDAVFTGYIYIVENSWQIYATDLTITGRQIKQDLLNNLTVKQQFGFNAEKNIWTKNTQTLDFDSSLLGTAISGRFIYVYSNYNFEPGFTKKTFTNEILSFEQDANKKEDSYWSAGRPIPLTEYELRDYRVKDSIQQVQNTAAYNDSIDRITNRVKVSSLLIGYNYNNTNESWTVSYLGLLKKIGFNTIQGSQLSPSFYFTKRNPEKITYTTIGTDMNYAFSEKRFRLTGTISRKFNDFNKRIVTFTGGSMVEQYNTENPINRIVNSYSSLIFRDNYMKLFDNTFARLSHQEEVYNGIYLFTTFEYTRKKSLFNHSNNSWFKEDEKLYTSNNPLFPYAYNTPTFDTHNMLKASVATSFLIGQKYQTRPNSKVVVEDTKLPKVYLKYEKGFASSISNYNFDHLSARFTYDLLAGRFGTLGTSVAGGAFLNNAKNIAFTDYKHFNGNQTYVGKSERYLDVFNLLPYYTHSTNDKYIEVHSEHDFNGYITNSIPGLKELDYHLVAGFHLLTLPERNPYTEYSIGLNNMGWGKFRFLRVDYVRSYENGFRSQGVVFGLTFLDFLE